MSWLLSFSWNTWEDWASLQSRVRSEKMKVARYIPKVLKIIGWERVTRPNIEECDTSSIMSIARFSVKENFDCFFNCPPYWIAQTLWAIESMPGQLPLESIQYTVEGRVDELLSIYSWNIPEGEYLWTTYCPSSDEDKSVFQEWIEKNPWVRPDITELIDLAKQKWVTLTYREGDTQYISRTAYRMLDRFIVWIRSSPQDSILQQAWREKFLFLFTLAKEYDPQ